MRHPIIGLALLGLAFGLASCTLTPAERTRVDSIERTACVIDQAGQLVIMPLEAVGSALEPLASVPIAVVHRAAQLGCKVVLARHTP